MDDARTIYLKQLVGRYLEFDRRSAELEHQYVAVREEMNLARERKSTYLDTLKAEGIDPKNIPPHLLNGQAPSISIPATDQKENETKAASDQLALVADGNDPETKAEGPYNKTHAVFLIVKDLFNRGVTSEEIYERGKEIGLDLSRDDVVRVVGRQVARELMEKKAGKYYLTAKGEAFNKFRKM